MSVCISARNSCRQSISGTLAGQLAGRGVMQKEPGSFESKSTMQTPITPRTHCGRAQSRMI